MLHMLVGEIYLGLSTLGINRSQFSLVQKDDICNKNVCVFLPLSTQNNPRS